MYGVVDTVGARLRVSDPSSILSILSIPYFVALAPLHSPFPLSLIRLGCCGRQERTAMDATPLRRRRPQWEGSLA